MVLIVTVQVIAELGIAAYAAAMNAHTNKTIHHPSEIQVPIACGDVAVYPGDIIVGDEEGSRCGAGAIGRSGGANCC